MTSPVRAFKALPHPVEYISSLDQRLKSGGLDDTSAFGFAAALRCRVGEPDADVSLAFESIKRDVDRPARRRPSCARLNLLADRDAIGARAQPGDGQEDQLFELAECFAFGHVDRESLLSSLNTQVLDFTDVWTNDKDLSGRRFELRYQRAALAGRRPGVRRSLRIVAPRKRLANNR
jgi:hypothetical protein